MRIKLPLTLLVLAASPCAIAQTAVTGSLADFGRGTSGGQSAGSWGMPQSSGGQSSAGQSSSQSAGGQSGPGQTGQTSGGQSGPGQTSGQTSGGQSGPGQTSGQTSGGQSGPGQSSTQTSGGQSGAAGQEDGSKGEPNLPDEGHSDGGRSQDPKGEPNLPDEGHSDGDGDGGRDGNSNNGDNGDGSDGDYKPLDDGDPQYDPSGNEGETEIPSGCAEANSTCAQCVRQAEENIQFNRRYLHIAWSISHSTLDYANKRIAFGDTVSGIHGAMALSWQLAGKPQIEEAMASLRKTYAKKYRDYTTNIERSLQTMADCEAENYSIRDLYQRFGFLYLEFVKSRYESPD
jgi:hypothetical protein